MGPWPKHSFGELVLMPDNQLALLKVEQIHGIHLSALILLGKLLYPTLSLLNTITPQPLKPCGYAAYFSKVSLFLIQSGLVGQ